MSELIAEARVLVTPDTTSFRTLLTTQLAAATKGVTVPVQVTPVATGGVAALAAQQRAISQVNREEVRGAVTAKNLAAQDREAALAAAAHARSLRGLSTGAASAGLSLVGLRGATLAASAPFLAGAAGAIAFTKALSSFSGFQSQLKVLQVTTQGTADEMAKASETAKQLGRDITLPGVSATDAAVAITELSKAGLSLEDSLAGARGVLQLATAAQISFQDATELTAGSLNSFGLQGAQAVKVADLLANAANAAQGSIGDMGLALQQSSAVARQVGLSIDDTVALLTLLARNGIQGSDAGTALRTSLLRLINPTKQAQAVLSKLNVQLRDAQGNIRPEVFADFARAQENLTRKQQDANSAIVFGQDAIRALAILGREGTAGLNEISTGLEKQGTAAKVAGARMTGMAGAAANLSNQLDTLGITLGKVFSGPATGFVSGIGNFVESLNEVSDKVGAFVKPTTIDQTSASVETLIQRVQGLQAAASFAPDENFAKALIQGADEVEKALTEAGQRLVRQGFLERFITDFTKASPDVKKAMEDNVITPAEEAVLSASAVGRAFLAALPHTSEFFQSFGLSAKGAVEDAAAALRDPAPVAAALRSNIEDATAQAKATAAAAGKAHGTVIVNAITDAIKAGKAALAEAIKQLPSASSVLQRDIAVAQAGGNQGQELSLLRQQEQRQQEFLDAVLARPQNEKNVELAEAAARNLDQTRSAIKSITDQRAAVARQAASEAEAAAKEEADAAAKVKAAQDQTFLQRQEDARTAQQRLVTRAQDTPGLQDDIQRQQQLHDLLQRQIAAIKASALDEQAKQQALRALKDARDDTTDEIKRLRDTDKKQRTEQREQAQEALESARLELGQATFDLTGDKNPLLRAIDAAIKDAIREKNAAKKGSVAFIQAQTEVRQLLKRRKDLLDTAKETTRDTASQGFTGFEFLQKTQGFASNLLGNLIPGFATGGLVGNTSAVQAQITDPGAGFEQTVPFGNQLDRGVRPVQVDTTNALLRQILASLNGAQTNPVEIRRNRFTSDAVMDTI